MRRNYVSVCAALSLLSHGLAVTIIGPVLEAIRLHYGASSGEIGLLFTGISAGFLTAMAASGILVKRFSRKRMTIAGQGLLSLVLIAFPFAGDIWAGIGLYFMFGFATGNMQISANFTVSVLNGENRSSALNVLHLFFGVGAFTGPFLSGWLHTLDTPFGWGTVYLLVGAISLVILLFMAGAEYPETVSGGELQAGTSGEPAGELYMASLVVIMVLYIGIEMGINSWSVEHMKKKGLTPLESSMLLSGFWLFMTVGRIVCAWLSRMMKALTILVLLSAGATACYCAYLLIPYPHYAGLMLPAAGFFLSGTFPILLGIGGDRWPSRMETVNTVLIGASGIGLMVFPWLVGIIRDATSLDWGMGLLLALVAMQTVLSLVLKKTGSR